MASRSSGNGVVGSRLAQAALEALDELRRDEQKLAHATEAECKRRASRIQRAADAYRMSRSSPVGALRIPVRVLRALRQPVGSHSRPRSAGTARSTPAVSLVPLRSSAPTAAALEIMGRSARLAATLEFGRRLVVGVIVSQHTLEGLATVWDVVPLLGSHGVEAQETQEMDLLVVESPAVVDASQSNMVDTVRACRARGVPSVLWASTDPLDRSSNMTIARQVDHVLTADLESVAWYARQLLHPRIGVCPSARISPPPGALPQRVPTPDAAIAAVISRNATAVPPEASLAAYAERLAHAVAGLQQRSSALDEVDVAAARLVNAVVSPDQARCEIAPHTYPSGSFKRKGVGRAQLSQTSAGLTVFFEGDGGKTWYVHFGGALDLTEVLGPTGGFDLRFELERAGTGTLGVNVSWSDKAGRPIPGLTYYDPGRIYHLVPPDTAAGLRVGLSVRGTGLAVVRSIALAPNLSEHDTSSSASDPDGWSRAMDALGVPRKDADVALLASPSNSLAALVPGRTVPLSPGTAVETVTRSQLGVVVIDRAALLDGPWAGAESAKGTRLARELARTAVTARSLGIPVVVVETPQPMDVHTALIREAAQVVVSPGVAAEELGAVPAAVASALSTLVDSRFSAGAR